jgi:hypothetical protein
MEPKRFKNTHQSKHSGQKLMTEQEWTERFFTYAGGEREEDIKQLARMFVWVLKKGGVKYSSYAEMEGDGVPLLIQHYWFTK